MVHSPRIMSLTAVLVLAATEPGEHRHQQAQFADTVAIREDLDEPLQRPPCARQATIERRKARGQARPQRGTALLSGAPESGGTQQII